MTNKTWERLKQLYLLNISYTAVRGVRYIISSELHAGISDELGSVYKACADGGFKPGEICSLNEICGAYVFIYNSEIMKKIIKETAQTANQWGSIVGNTWAGFDESVKTAKGRLSETMITNMRAGYTAFDAVLYGMRESWKYNLTAYVNGAKCLIEYPCFNLPHTSINQVNNEYLIPRGFRISGINFKALMPANQGILASVKCETLN